MTASTIGPVSTGRTSRLRPDRRIAAAWARLLVAALVVLVPVAIVLGGTQSAHRAGAAAVRAALTTVSAALEAQHTVTGGWPADLVAVGTSVVDTAGHRIATIPAGVAVDYQRSIDGSRVVVRISDRGASAAFDSAAAVR
ncbi:hypothetical protein [Amnibacterium sp.]|uniref:hypothetical protein n=1 Tax=Amnibacterium sp. TaxID=1872496 RepID=UPI002633803B|nr:hypothetical protein [Amnibacterium sp.]MCU1472456.1 hypothetical protein [Amnibacterium sp.]